MCRKFATFSAVDCPANTCSKSLKIVNILKVFLLRFRIFFFSNITGECPQTNPATGGQGYFDGAGHLGMLSWLGLDLLVSLMGLKTQAVSDMCKINGSRPQGTGHCTRAV